MENKNRNTGGLEDGILDLAITLSQKEYESSIGHLKGIDEKIGRYLVLLPILLVPSMNFFIFILGKDETTMQYKFIFAYTPFFLILFLSVLVVKKLIEALSFRNSYRMPKPNDLVESFVNMESTENRTKENFQGYVLVRQEEVIKLLQDVSHSKIKCLKHLDCIIVIIFVLLLYWVVLFFAH